MKHTLIALTVSVFGPTLLFAGETAIRESKNAVAAPAPHELCDWTGFYIGANVGYAFEGNADVKLNLTGEWEAFQEPSDETFGERLGSKDLKADGVEAGLFLGYNHQWNQFVFGLEAQFNYTDLEASYDSGVLSVSPGSGDAMRVRHKYETHYLMTFGPRVGYVWDRVLLYATGGLAVGQLKFSQEIDEPQSNFTQRGSTDDAQVGWTVGGGVQYCLNEHWSVRAEYRYVDLSCADFSSVGSDSVFTGRHEACLTFHSVTAGLAYKF